MEKNNDQLAVFQAKNGSIELKTDIENDTVWASKKQIAELFDIDRSVVSRHIKNIFNDAELTEQVVSAKFAHTTQHGALKDKEQTKLVDYYNLDIILSVGYRTKSTVAIKFRQWATKTLKSHITKGYSINQKRLEDNKIQFLQTLEDLKILTDRNRILETKDVLSLIQNFSSTFFALDSYDRDNFPKQGTKKEIKASGTELFNDIQQLKTDLIQKEEATELFAQEKNKGNLEGIFGTVFQSVFGEDAYPTVEEKAAHLLYFIVKNHPFNDGNKRSAAFSFVWLLHKANYNYSAKINPETLTTLTLLIAETSPSDKDKMIGVVQLLLTT